MEFRVDFGAEDAARLTPCKDDKPKYTEITLFQASSDYSLSAKIFQSVKTDKKAVEQSEALFNSL